MKGDKKMSNVGNIAIENARLIFRNFEGKEGKYNRSGDRSFCLVIPDEAMANQLSDDGWNVKALPARDGDEEVLYYIPVSVNYQNIPPEIYTITRHGKELMTEGMVASLDYADILEADVIARPYNWEVNGKTGIKAYLKTMYVTIQEDEFAAKYQ
jgi:hypothetical protein